MRYLPMVLSVIGLVLLGLYLWDIEPYHTRITPVVSAIFSLGAVVGSLLVTRREENEPL